MNVNQNLTHQPMVFRTNQYLIEKMVNLKYYLIKKQDIKMDIGLAIQVERIN